MGKPVAVFYWLLLALGPAAAQAEKAEQALPNWLTGIIAVGVFLFLIFVAFLVNKAWCETPRSIDNPKVLDHQTDEKVTEM
ncbi:PDZK1-interacting protein 1 [Puntigrus tetrazona]|uniref:PDZK1-interacting protein 1 n=1 Tax=Puntigrus tetrazona TaxID=1606681 RepID=UPI001C8977A6|nr:PDZK1-interacting protein 1 [Puntigrus tetrazona]